MIKHFLVFHNYANKRWLFSSYQKVSPFWACLSPPESALNSLIKWSFIVRDGIQSVDSINHGAHRVVNDRAAHAPPQWAGWLAEGARAGPGPDYNATEPHPTPMHQAPCHYGDGLQPTPPLFILYYTRCLYVRKHKYIHKCVFLLSEGYRYFHCVFRIVCDFKLGRVMLFTICTYVLQFRSNYFII